MSQKNPLDKLFNEEDISNNEILFKQYRLYVEMADNISSRRAIANGFFLTAISLLGAMIGIIIQAELYIYLLSCSLIGVIMSIFWFTLINRYKEYNKAKFGVINKMEEKLPVKGYTVEWELFKQEKKGFLNLKLTDVERFVPLFLILFFIAIFILSLLKLMP